MKKFTTCIVIITLLFGVFGGEAFALAATTTAATTATATATPTDSKILVNGADVVFIAYLINDYNYFKLRDIAYTLSGTEKQFEVGWDDASGAISLTSGQPYTSVGDEMTGGGAVGGAGVAVKTALPTSARIFKDGEEVKFTAYNIDGYNYFKLRDIGEAFDFGVDWDDARNTIAIDTSKGYTTDNGSSEDDAVSSVSTAKPGDAAITALGADTWTQNDYLEAYGEVLATWKADLKKHNNDEQVFGMTFEFWFYNGYSDQVKTFYALYDIDGNGVKELLLKKKDDAGYEEILAYIFTLKDGKPINLFGYDADSGAPREVPWSRVGSGEILYNGLIDCYYADYRVYQIAADGYSLVELAYAEPYDYPDEASKAEAEWRYYIYGEEVDYDYYIEYLAGLDYTPNGSVTLADIDWVGI